MTKNYLNLPAPAKINLFLHIIGKRSDGYHLLQSVFQLIDLNDYLDFEELSDNQVIRTGDINWPIEKDLCYKAARLLQQYAPTKGVKITVRKHIPDGAGLGGGSSDAATTLIALNRLWDLNLNRAQLQSLAVQLGADVPFFIFGQNAFVEGIGEKLSAIETPEFKYGLVFPNDSISTAAIFSSPDLTRNSNPCTIADFFEQLKFYAQSPWGKNDLEPVARNLSASVDQAIKLLESRYKPRMTGSGSAVFYAVEYGNEISADLDLPINWKQWVVNGLKCHPLSGWIVDSV